MVAVALIATLSLATAQAQIPGRSQPPVPSAAKITQPQQQNTAPKPSISADNSAAPNNGAASPNLIFSPKIDIKTGDDSGHSKNEPSNDYFGYILGAIGTVIALFTLLAIRRQADIMGGTLQQMKIDSADRAKEMGRQLDIAQESLTKLQRASAFVPNFEWNWHPDTERPGKFWYHFRPIIENSGNTQTEGMLTNIVFTLRDAVIPPDFGFPPSAESFPAIVPPHGTIKGGTGTLTDDELDQVKAGTRFYYIYGTLTYRDIFDGTPTHTTKFCRQVISILGDVMSPNTAPVEMFFAIVHAHHNTAD